MSLILSPRPQVLQRLASERAKERREKLSRGEDPDTAHDDDHQDELHEPDDDDDDDGAEGVEKAGGADKAAT